MSRLINIDPQIQHESEPEGYEFGYYTFDTLPAMEVSNIETTQDATDVNERDAKENLITLPLDNNKLSELQSQDAFCANILTYHQRANV